jgi:lysozyme
MPELNAVIDLSHHNQNLDFPQIKNAGGIVGVIHKATQGVTYMDPVLPLVPAPPCQHS